MNFCFSRCLLNCEKSNLIPTKLTALQVDCKNCGPNAFIISAYIWQLYHKQTEYEILPVPYSAWRSKSPTGNNKNVIVLLQETLNSSSSYELAVTGELTCFLGICQENKVDITSIVACICRTDHFK